MLDKKKEKFKIPYQLKKTLKVRIAANIIKARKKVKAVWEVPKMMYQVNSLKMPHHLQVKRLQAQLNNQ